MSETWREFWDGSHRIYVNERHWRVHYARVADDIIEEIPGSTATILDYGCGEALEAGRVAKSCARLLLCESGPTLRASLKQRHSDSRNISVVAPEDIPALHDGEIDLIVVNSVLQYLTPKECADLAAVLRPKLSRTGRLIFADVIPPGTGIVADVSSLLGNAWKNGFFLAAIGGLAMTFVSDYRRLRQQLGLTTYREADIKALLEQAGYEAERRPRNFGFNQQRMTIIARPKY